MAAAEKPVVAVPVGEAPSYQLEVEDLEVGEGEEATAEGVVTRADTQRVLRQALLASPHACPPASRLVILPGRRSTSLRRG